MEKDSPPRWDRLVFHQVDRERWTDLERLFESRGGPMHCWCMVWRTMPRGISRSDRRAKKGAMERRVAEGVPVGVLGYLDKEPVAWCSIAPRDSYRHLGGENGRADGARTVHKREDLSVSFASSLWEGLPIEQGSCAAHRARHLVCSSMEPVHAVTILIWPESTEGRPWGQPLKKLAARPRII